MFQRKAFKFCRLLILCLLLFFTTLVLFASAASPKFLTLPFEDSGIKLQQGWYYTYSSATHEGIDYIKGTIDQASSWQEFDVRAAEDGEAIYTIDALRWGNYVRIKHVQGTDIYYTLYAHLKSFHLFLQENGAQ